MSSASRKYLLLDSRNVWQIYSSSDFRIIALGIQNTAKIWNTVTSVIQNPGSGIWNPQGVIQIPRPSRGITLHESIVKGLNAAIFNPATFSEPS